MTMYTNPMQFPYQGETAADEGLLPPRWNGPPAYQYQALMSSPVYPYYLAGYNPTPLPCWRLARAMDNVLQYGGHCCMYSAAGCNCNCQHRQRGVLDFLYAGVFDGSIGYAQPATDWPNIGTRAGYGPGPYVKFPDVFPLRGRANLAPFNGY